MLYNACPILTAAHHPVNVQTTANVVSDAQWPWKRLLVIEPDSNMPQSLNLLSTPSPFLALLVHPCFCALHGHSFCLDHDGEWEALH